MTDDGPKYDVDKWARLYIWDLTRDQQRMMLHSRFSFPTTIPCFVHCNIDAFSFLYSSQPPHFALWRSGFVGEMGAVIRTHHITWSSLILFAQGKVHFPLQDGKILALLCFISFFFHHPLFMSSILSSIFKRNEKIGRIMFDPSYRTLVMG